MGLLAVGTPLPWNESREFNDLVKEKGVQYILQIFKNAQDRDGDVLYWGDELEYMLLQFNGGEKSSKLDVSHDEILEFLNVGEDLAKCNDQNIHFHPEYGRFMLEATPSKPYLAYEGDDYVEYNMKSRRLYAEKMLSYYNDKKGNVYKPLTITSFPRLGRENSVSIDDHVLWNHKNNASRSIFLPDEMINKHIRFPTLTANIRMRRGEKVAINVPIFKDINTPEFDTRKKRDWFLQEDSETGAALPNHIYMDSMGFGMGCSCLQTTYQAPNLKEARYVYDALCNFAPVMLALSSAAPIFKGWLADQDVRWNVIAGSTDDRTPMERSVQPLLPTFNDGFGGIAQAKRSKVTPISKSRYSKVDLFLGGNKFFKRNYNNTDVPLNEKVLKTLLENDISPMDYDMAKHFAHLYVRDPLVIFEETLNDDSIDALQNHFENIQSTNWQTLRFKPPTHEATPDNKAAPGWRVEFRPMEVQLTDFENAAYSIFIYLIVESLLVFSDSLDAYINMSDIWENMDFAHEKDPTVTQKFHWKTSFNNDLNKNGASSLYSIEEIFHNTENGIFQIFINPILKHKNFIAKDWKELKSSREHLRLYYYLKVISDRSSGKIPTTARFMREFVLKHQDYKQDSKVSELINFDLLSMCDRITHFNDSKNELSSYFGKELGEYLQTSKLTYE